MSPRNEPAVNHYDSGHSHNDAGRLISSVGAVSQTATRLRKPEHPPHTFQGLQAAEETGCSLVLCLFYLLFRGLSRKA